jgi:Tol biopolymer transport system component
MNELSMFERRLAAGLEAYAGPRRSVDAIAIARTAASQAPVRRSVLSRVSALIGQGAGVQGHRPGDLGVSRSARPLVVFVLIALITALALGAIAVGSGLVRLTSVLPPPTPTSSLPVSGFAGEVAVLHHLSEPPDPGYPDVNSLDGQIWVEAGGAVHPLFPERSGTQDGFDWSPDGARLVFTEAGKVYLSDATGATPELLDTKCEALCRGDRFPAFSADGRLLFNRTIDANGGSLIAWLDFETGRVVEIEPTAITYSTDGHGPHGFAYQRARWSPDGGQVVFSRWNMFYGGTESLFVVQTDGSNLRALPTLGVVARDPDWSPDGMLIVFSSMVFTGSQASGDLQIAIDLYTVRPDGSDLRRLTDDGISSGATWTDDGRIAFTRIPGGRTAPGAVVGGSLTAEVWAMAADGTNQVKLAELPNAARLLFSEDAALQPRP